LGKLTGGIAHDYNNMQVIITGYADLLKEKLAEQPDIGAGRTCVLLQNDNQPTECRQQWLQMNSTY